VGLLSLQLSEVRAMIKRMLVSGVCLSLLALLSGAGQVEGAKVSFQKSSVQGEVEKLPEQQENGQSISLPPTNGAWLIEMSRDGGMRPGKRSVQLNSAGEISVVSEHFEGGRIVVGCSLKEKLSTEDFQKLKAAMSRAKLSSWRERYEDPKNPICCDQPTTHLTVRRREIAEGDGGGDGTISQTTSWYPGSAEFRPPGLVKLAEVAQTLWNKVSGRCAN
jgi:hypothetical protein